jgi:hypothetical protein
MTSPRLPLVKAQQSFLSGIRRSREQHGPKVKVTAPPIIKRKFGTLWVLPFDQTSRKPSVLTDRNAVGPTISKYISDRMSGKT